MSGRGFVLWSHGVVEYWSNGLKKKALSRKHEIKKTRKTQFDTLRFSAKCKSFGPFAAFSYATIFLLQNISPFVLSYFRTFVINRVFRLSLVIRHVSFVKRHSLVLHTPYCLLLSAYCLLLTAYCFLYRMPKLNGSSSASFMAFFKLDGS
jgi:hypothetical protein